MSDRLNPEILGAVARYYADKLARFGSEPRGVDWNGAESQWLRFLQLVKIIDGSAEFSINDLGCGYGALYDYLSQTYSDFAYTGIDISGEMIQAAESRFQGFENSRFIVGGEPTRLADYGIASGIFNVRQDQSDETWLHYLEETLDALDRTSKLGFSFNCLTRYSDADKMQACLYYADPCALFDYCKSRYSRNVALLHDYGLYEFTILVRKET